MLDLTSVSFLAASLLSALVADGILLVTCTERPKVLGLHLFKNSDRGKKSRTKRYKAATIQKLPFIHYLLILWTSMPLSK